MLAVIASTLNKIETHLSKISKVASNPIFVQNIHGNSNENGSGVVPNQTTLSTNQAGNSNNLNNNNDGNNNSLSIAGVGTNVNTLSSQSGTEV